MSAATTVRIRSRSISPTARSLALLRSRGALCAVVEKWNSHAKVRQDLFGFADILAINPPETGCTAIQACITRDIGKRTRKLTTAPVVAKVDAWIRAGNRVYIWGWAKRGKRGEVKHWKMTEIDVADELAVTQ